MNVGTAWIRSCFARGLRLVDVDPDDPDLALHFLRERLDFGRHGLAGLAPFGHELDQHR